MVRQRPHDHDEKLIMGKIGQMSKSCYAIFIHQVAFYLVNKNCLTSYRVESLISKILLTSQDGTSVVVPQCYMLCLNVNRVFGSMVN